MVNWNEVEARLRRADDLRHEAGVGQRWLWSAGRPQPDRFFWRLEAAMGNWLMTLGGRLQAHVESMRRLAQPSAPALIQHRRPGQHG